MSKPCNRNMSVALHPLILVVDDFDDARDKYAEVVDVQGVRRRHGALRRGSHRESAR
jgi:hypothetical protein